MVVAGGVELEFVDGLAVGAGDADVEVLDEHEDFGAGVTAAEADVVESAPVTERELAEAVDDVMADSVVGVVEALEPRRGLGPGVVGTTGCSSAESSVRSDVVVVVAEGVELGLEFGGGVDGGLAGEPLLSVWWKRSTFPQVWGW